MHAYKPFPRHVRNELMHLDSQAEAVDALRLRDAMLHLAKIFQTREARRF